MDALSISRRQRLLAAIRRAGRVNLRNRIFAEHQRNQQALEQQQGNLNPNMATTKKKHRKLLAKCSRPEKTILVNNLCNDVLSLEPSVDTNWKAGQISEKTLLEIS